VRSIEQVLDERNIKAVIMDLDGFLYNQTAEVKQAVLNAVYEVVAEKQVKRKELWRGYLWLGRRVVRWLGRRAFEAKQRELEVELDREPSAVEVLEQKFDIKERDMNIEEGKRIDLYKYPECFRRNQSLIDFLQGLRDQGLTLILVSNSPEKWHSSAIDMLGVAEFFTEVIGTDTEGITAAKPHHSPFLRAFDKLKELGITPDQVIAGGDNETNDVRAAIDAAAQLGYKLRGGFVAKGPESLMARFDDCMTTLERKPDLLPPVILHEEDPAIVIAELRVELERAKSDGDSTREAEIRQRLDELMNEADAITMAYYEDPGPEGFSQLTGRRARGVSLEFFENFVEAVRTNGGGKPQKILVMGIAETEARFFSELGDPNIKAVGVNLSRLSVDALKAEDDITIPIYEGDMHDLSQFQDGEFDAVLCTTTVLHSCAIDSKQGAAVAFKEMNRVIRPGGIADFSVKEEVPGEREEFMALTDKRGRRYFQFYNMDSLAEILVDTGYSLPGPEPIKQQESGRGGEFILLAHTQKPLIPSAEPQSQHRPPTPQFP